MKSVIQSYYNYNDWATDRLFTTAAQVSPEQWLAPSSTAVGSLREVMTHIVSCERGWIGYVQGQDIGDLNPEDFDSVTALRAVWNEINETTKRYIANLGDEALVRPIPWKDFNGETHDYPQWKLLLHQANHAMQHRSEAALILTQMGASTDWMDYLIFVNWVEQPWQSPTS